MSEALALNMISSINDDPLAKYLSNNRIEPLFLTGDACALLRTFPNQCVDCCITSPPYWGKRQYDSEGIGMEKEYTDYIASLLIIFKEVKRVLKDDGSFWLNIGDTYKDKRLLGVPWRVALAMTDEQGWILRNEVIWNKVKGGQDNSKDKLGNVHEQLFHFVKKERGYRYDVDAIRSTPYKSKIVNGSIVSATGVSGVRYKRQIEMSTALNEREKETAMKALNNMLSEIQRGKIADFRMIIRKQQRTTHSDSEKVSGRAKELKEKGFYFLKYHPNGSKPRDVWEIIPEDTQNRKLHYAAFPEDLCKIPILATCPSKGVVLDPFTGTGTAMFTAMSQGKKSIGIDICPSYTELARNRCATLF